MRPPEVAWTFLFNSADSCCCLVGDSSLKTCMLILTEVTTPQLLQRLSAVQSHESYNQSTNYKSRQLQILSSQLLYIYQI